jgi:hypothetical protein
MPGITARQVRNWDFRLVQKKRGLFSTRAGTCTSPIKQVGAIPSMRWKGMGGTGIGLDIPAIVEAGKTIPVEVISQDGNATLALHFVCHGEDELPRGNPKLMKALGDGRYHAKLDDLPQGAYRTTVQSATPAKPIDPVSDWTLVWNANVALS